MVDVNTQNKTISVNVSSSGVSSNVNASGDTTLYYSNKAREWAISNRIVDGVDYSSKYYAGKANESALNAQSFAQSTQDSYNNVQNIANKALDDIETDKTNAISDINSTKSTALTDINTAKNNAVNMVNTTASNLANKDLSNLSSVGEKHFLTKSQITNCLLEVPQNIKLELNNGTLTLKAGSKVIVPNGDGVFEEITIANDLTRTWTHNGKGVVCATSSALLLVPLAQISSGTTAPTVTTTYWLWYDTTNNQIKFTSDNGATWTGAWSLPTSLITGTASGIASIDQVFNGLGYIGSTIWVDKGVKYLVPNGRNEDGTLNNIEFTINRIIPSTLTFGAQDYYLSLNEYGETAIFAAKTVTKYDSDRNVIIDTYANMDRLWCFAGECTADVNNKITSFSIKQPFRAVDYNDLQSLLPTGAIISSASSTSPAGFLMCNGSAVSRTTYTNLFKAIGTTYGTGDGSTTFNLPNYSNYNFVTSATVGVKGDGKALGFYDNQGHYCGGMRMYGGNGNAYVVDGGYGKAAGTKGLAAASAFADGILTGVTTDATKSGLTGTVTTAKLNWYIKY